jgi:hypothetical protein
MTNDLHLLTSYCLTFVHTNIDKLDHFHLLLGNKNVHDHLDMQKTALDQDDNQLIAFHLNEIFVSSTIWII